MKPIALLTLLINLLTLPVTGQGLIVTGSTPADRDSTVALETTVRFDFTSPIDTTARFSNGWPVAFFAIQPADSIQIDSLYFNDSLTQVAFDVLHTRDTDFVWVLTGAVTQDSTTLCNPYVLNYTTAAQYGPFRVGGYVATAIPLGKSQDCPSQNMYAEQTIVALMDGNPTDTESRIVSALRVAQAIDFEFVLPGVRAGTYWPAAFSDTNNDGEIIPNWGLTPSLQAEATFQDIDLFAGPDSIVIPDTSETKIELMFIGPGSTILPKNRLPFARLEAGFPNPFYESTTLSLHLDVPVNDVIRLEIVDILGRVIHTLIRERRPPGSHQVVWSGIDDAGRRVAAGVYFARLYVGDQQFVRPILKTHR